jgi:integrase
VVFGGADPVAFAGERTCDASVAPLLRIAGGVDMTVGPPAGARLANPSLRLGRTLRLVTPKTTRQEHIEAFDRHQLDNFLKTPHELEPSFYPLFLTLARTGMRIGEAIALKWDDINFSTREIRVERAISAGKLSTPKSGHGRTVDMSRGLAEQLARLDSSTRAEKLGRGLIERPSWVFASQAGTPVDPSKVAKAFRRVLGAADGFRHSFASLLLPPVGAQESCSTSRSFPGASWTNTPSRS